ncbi:FeS assembly SUF system protein [Thermoactinomyces vulgaris]|nr:FeS assembly SUF system protein [Thermoactinomyces vulgaris]
MQKEQMKEQIMEQLEQVNDPELNIDIVNLGLVYDIDIDDEGNVKVTMTLTAMGCPLAGIIQQEVEQALKNVEGVNKVDVEIVWNPPWDKSRMSRYAKIALGIPD